MLASLLTAVFFSISILFAAESAKAAGPMLANIARLVLATVLLGIWSVTGGHGLGGPALPWFLLSGFIGYGLGDMSMFASLPRIGPRLAILLTQCLATPIAATAEYLWLDTTVGWVDLLTASGILVGVALALAPDNTSTTDRRQFFIGILFGIGSAAGQALGAVVSRKANAVAEAAGMHVDGGTAAFERIIMGTAVTLLTAAVLSRRARVSSQPEAPVLARLRKGAPLIVGNSLAGPALGVACYQIALLTTPSVIVLPIVATSPLVTMLFTFLFKGSRPGPRAILGGFLAVGCAIALSLRNT
jgi:drug/metabolite transporter (DMT)-like permease